MRNSPSWIALTLVCSCLTRLAAAQCAPTWFFGDEGYDDLFTTSVKSAVTSTDCAVSFNLVKTEQVDCIYTYTYHSFFGPTSTVVNNSTSYYYLTTVTSTGTDISSALRVTPTSSLPTPAPAPAPVPTQTTTTTSSTTTTTTTSQPRPTTSSTLTPTRPSPSPLPLPSVDPPQTVNSGALDNFTGGSTSTDAYTALTVILGLICAIFAGGNHCPSTHHPTDPLLEDSHEKVSPHSGGGHSDAPNTPTPASSPSASAIAKAVLQYSNSRSIFLLINQAGIRSRAVPLWAANSAVDVAYLTGTFSGSLPVTLFHAYGSGMANTKDMSRLATKLTAGLQPNLMAGVTWTITALLLLLNWIGCLASPLGRDRVILCEVQGPELLGLHVLLLGVVAITAVPFLRPLSHAVQLVGARGQTDMQDNNYLAVPTEDRYAASPPYRMQTITPTVRRKRMLKSIEYFPMENHSTARHLTKTAGIIMAASGILQLYVPVWKHWTGIAVVAVLEGTFWGILVYLLGVWFSAGRKLI
ncbi:hypothetical protein HDV00_005493 [Rhizophlyctis rosea]|nr:hypothetical protein HDV00_005493 [Rhizophlyctis rosea]